MSMDWIARQLFQAGSRGSLKREIPRSLRPSHAARDVSGTQKYNPRPANVMQERGAAKAVLAFLQASPGRFFTFNQLLHGTGRTAKAVDWACIFLRSLGHVECSRGDDRNPRYRRYRFKTNKDKT